MNTQRIAAIVRQVVGVVGIVFGIVTASVSSLHLPVAVSTALTIGGTVILAIEHYVGDPSTGTTQAPTVPVTVTAVAPTSAPTPPAA